MTSPIFKTIQQILVKFGTGGGCLHFDSYQSNIILTLHEVQLIPKSILTVDQMFEIIVLFGCHMPNISINTLWLKHIKQLTVIVTDYPLQWYQTHKHKDHVQENEQRVYGKSEETYNKCVYRRRHRCKREKLDNQKGHIMRRQKQCRLCYKTEK